MQYFLDRSNANAQKRSKILSPEILSTLCEMGHADTIVLGDANFPAKTCAKQGEGVYIRMDGISIVPLLRAILSLIPLDYSKKPIKLMKPDRDVQGGIWKDYISEINKSDKRGEDCIEYLKRDEFYEESKKAFCVVQTGETAIYANIIIQKGVIE